MADKLQVLMQFEICDRHFFVFMSPSPPQWRIKAVEITTAAVWEHAVRVFGNQPKRKGGCTPGCQNFRIEHQMKFLMKTRSPLRPSWDVDSWSQCRHPTAWSNYHYVFLLTSNSRLPRHREKATLACHARKENPLRRRRHSYDFASPDDTAQLVCLKNESRSDCIKMHEALIAKHAPATYTEHLLVQHLAVTRWRLQRARLMENAVLVRQMDHMMDDLAQTHESMDEAARTDLCIRTLTQTSPSFKFLLRYRRSLSRQFDRWLACLALFRTGGRKQESRNQS